MPGIKHLIECHCKLQIYKNNVKIIYHKFPVYSKLDKDNKIIPKFVKCNNCEAMHKVINVGISEIAAGKDQSSFSLTKEDISYSLSDTMVDVLVKHDSDISNYEHVKDIIDEKRWNEIVVLKREIINEETVVKYLTITGKSSFKINSETIKDTIIGEKSE